MRRNATKLFALLMTLCMLVGVLPMQLLAAELTATQSDVTYVLAASDFQAESGHSEGQTIVSNILTQVKKDYAEMDGFLFAGDYDYKMTVYGDSSVKSDTEGGKAKLRQTVQGVYGTSMDEVYVQGNHDNDSMAGSICSPSGANDPDSGAYGVFVINEKDYMWSTQKNEESTVKATAANLESYLDAKLEEGYSKPIFVMSHLPLHYSMRTRKDSDGMYANYIFDVLNDAGLKGLNIIFLFGHNHSHGWDDYLGGSSIFLTKDDKINIAQASRTDFKEETLYFTYMNAGYVGYYGETGSGVDSTLTMTTFAISDDEVEIRRYDANGKHLLESAGAYGCGYGLKNSGDNYSEEYDEKAKNYYPADTSTTASPATVALVKLGGITNGGNPGLPDLGGSAGGSMVTTTGNVWVTVKDKVTQTKYVYEPVTSINAGDSYVILSGSETVALKNNNGSFADVTSGLEIKDSKLYSDTELDLWTFSGSSSGTVKNGNHYLRCSSSTFKLDSKSTSLSFSKTTYNNSNEYRIAYKLSSRRTNYFGYKNSSWSNNNENDSTVTVRLYKYSTTETTILSPAEYAIAEGKLEYTLTRGATGDDAIAAVKNGISVYSSTNEKATKTPVPDSEVTFTLAENFNGDIAGEYAVTVSYGGKTLAVAKVVIPERDISSVQLINLEGTVQRGAAASTSTGAKLRVTYDDGGDPDYIAVTVDMLRNSNDDMPSTESIATLENLTVLYRDKKAEDSFTLYVVGKLGNNYPEYPNEGAVKVNKTATGQQFTSTGVAKVELSASGIPTKKGADVIVMLDLSSSMYTNSVNGKRRVEILEASLQNMIEDFKTPNEDGSIPDIRIAVADFNRYYGSDSPYYIEEKDRVITSGADRHMESNGTHENLIYTGTGDLTAGAFVNIKDVNKTDFSSITGNTHSGTNYDYAFDTVYQLGEAITEQNEKDGATRDLFVVFMSDGAPFQYNYFSSHSSVSSWNNWLDGTMKEDMYGAGARKDYYNTDGKHWMAEAIKGDTDTMYPVIRKNDDRDTDGNNWIEVNGLGAKMYSIGFCLAIDDTITLEAMDTVIRNIASSSEYYWRADDADALDTAFTAITTDILYAAQNARFVDTMGEHFKLQTATVEKGASGNTLTDSIVPTIEVISYDIYTRSDYENCTISDVNLIGTRKGTFTVIERVTFDKDGTKAYSDQINGGVPDIYGTDGVIRAKYFYYNTNSTAVAIDGISIPTGTTAGNLTTGSTNLLPAETFYWNLGTVKSAELALSYYVYLEGSMEGSCASGSYPTNTAAVLYYDNYLENPCKKDTVSPVMPWGEAHVRYAFYLVNGEGEIIVNRTSGETGSFANRIAVTNPVVAETINLNSGDHLEASLLAKNYLPTGYTLYDKDAKYTIHVSSDEGSYWEIDSKQTTQSTYVTGYNGNEFTNAAESSGGERDYTHTTVWFAVVWTVGAIDDTVVVDFGLPVNISVLDNDMFGDNGKLNALGKSKPDGEYSATSNTTFKPQLETKNGMAVIAGSNVKYQLTSMTCASTDTFAYEVAYTGDNSVKQYYYGEVNVVPASTVYFEESFVTYTDSTNTDSELGKWTQVGVADTQTGASQDEDRPGKFSINDANNLYGYDATYSAFTEYSLGGAMKVTVDANTGSGKNAPKASFTFTGTGFDIISLTNSDSGLITASVYKKNSDGTRTYKTGLSVCNYYGYTYDETNGWVATPGEDCIWQVPVLKFDGLEYATYEVEIKVLYSETFDLTGDHSYSFWLDAIRIYDPVDTDSDETAKDAYIADGELAPSYITLRDVLVNAGSLGEITSGDETKPGVVFIDGKAATDKIDDYKNPGPNNETYLAYGQGVAFKLHSTTVPASVHLGVKLAKGTKASVNYTVAGSDGKLTTNKTREFATASDMFYDLGQYLTWYEDPDNGGYTTGTIVLSNATDSDAVISVTNIKYTFAETETAATLEAVINSEVVSRAVSVMSMYAPVDNTDPFVPETLESFWAVGKTSVLTVKTSTDVARVTVNGTELKSVLVPSVSFKNGRLRITCLRAWIYTARLDADEHSFEITAYDENGKASLPIDADVEIAGFAK